MGTFYHGAPCDVPCGIRRSEGVSGRIVLLHAPTVGNGSRASSPSASRPSRLAQGARELRIQLFRGSCCRLRSMSSTVLAEDSPRLFARMIHLSLFLASLTLSSPVAELLLWLLLLLLAPLSSSLQCRRRLGCWHGTESCPRDS